MLAVGAVRHASTETRASATSAGKRVGTSRATTHHSDTWANAAHGTTGPTHATTRWLTPHHSSGSATHHSIRSANCATTRLTTTCALQLLQIVLHHLHLARSASTHTTLTTRGATTRSRGTALRTWYSGRASRTTSGGKWKGIDCESSEGTGNPRNKEGPGEPICCGSIWKVFQLKLSLLIEVGQGVITCNAQHLNQSFDMVSLRIYPIDFTLTLLHHIFGSSAFVFQAFFTVSTHLF